MAVCISIYPDSTVLSSMYHNSANSCLKKFPYPYITVAGYLMTLYLINSVNAKEREKTPSVDQTRPDQTKLSSYHIFTYYILLLYITKE